MARSLARYSLSSADQDIDPDDDGAGTDGHGSHVAGIAVGYAEGEDGEIIFSGAAPQAQLLAMKIFSTAASTTTSDIYFAALEVVVDAAVLKIFMARSWAWGAAPEKMISPSSPSA